MTSTTERADLMALTQQVEDARALVAAGRIEEAIETFARLVELRPDMHDLSAALCGLLPMVGRTDPRPAWIRGAVAHDPSMLERFHETAMNLHTGGDLEAARRYLEGLVTCQPTHPDLLNDLGIVQFELDDATTAESTLRMALLSDPAHAEAKRSLAHVLVSQERIEDARALCEQAPGLIEEILGEDVPPAPPAEVCAPPVTAPGSGEVSALTSAIWFLTWRCNLRCAYCWEVQRLAKGELEPEPFRPADECADAWNRLRPGILDITGGEPFMQPDFLELLDALDDGIRIAITTNLSYDMTEFVGRMSPEKIFSMTVSLHPTQKLPFDHFLGRALLLKNRGFNITVNYVTWPEQLWVLPRYKEAVESAGLRFHVDPYASTPHHPFEFTEAEKQFMRGYLGEDRDQHWFGEIDKSPVMCSGGFNHINVQPDGEAYRCIDDKVRGMSGLGNIFDPAFALNAEWTRCENYWRCPGCDKDKVSVKQIVT
jgi:MoaA/NifB/PqqE/SkfB family radical SAM enzyme